MFMVISHVYISQYVLVVTIRNLFKALEELVCIQEIYIITKTGYLLQFNKSCIQQ